MVRNSNSVAFAIVVFACSLGQVSAQTRLDKVLNDRKKVEAEGTWIYGDLPRGFEEAKKTGKPLMVVLRCLPCEECVKLDDELIDKNPKIAPLLDKFVRVRQVSTNGLDLSLFQYDYDQSFAIFFLNADKTIYGRFGTRSHRTEWQEDLSVEGLAKAMEAALELHNRYPRVSTLLAAKTGPAPDFASPEKYPLLSGRYQSTLVYNNQVVQSCIHCHQIGDAQRQLSRSKKQPMPERLLFSYPHPKAIGLTLDPQEIATILKVDEDSPAAQAGLQSGDVITALGIKDAPRQPLISIADVQWVLQQADPNGAALEASVEREGKIKKLSIELSEGWRQKDNLSWRASSWGLRRMATGGMLLEPLNAEQRAAAGILKQGMALRIKHLGQFGPHAAAKNAGVRPSDILVSFDGKRDFARETDLFAYALTNCMSGQKVPIVMLRDGKEIEIILPMQD